MLRLCMKMVIVVECSKYVTACSELVLPLGS